MIWPIIYLKNTHFAILFLIFKQKHQADTLSMQSIKACEENNDWKIVHPLNFFDYYFIQRRPMSSIFKACEYFHMLAVALPFLTDPV